MTQDAAARPGWRFSDIPGVACGPDVCTPNMPAVHHHHETQNDAPVITMYGAECEDACLLSWQEQMAARRHPLSEAQ